jgi:hypothetical protein
MLLGQKAGGEGIPLPDSPFAMKVFARNSIKRMEDCEEDRISLVHVIHLSGKSSCCSMLRIVLCSTVSKAFSKSNLRIIISCLD